MANRGCADCCYSVHSATSPLITEQATPYDEVCHQVENNTIAIRVPKDIGQIRALQGNESGFDSGSASLRSKGLINVSCSDAHGRKCEGGCVKVNVIPNQSPPIKKPEEEMFLLRSTRQYLNPSNVKNTLEVEFKAARNYASLPDPGPSPPIIQISRKKHKKTTKKGGKRRKK